ncbi:MAG: hypothetical protein ABIR79_22475 [Candidatus Binatia bacterium]
MRNQAVLALVMATVVGMPTVGSAQNRGVQFTPDGKRVLVNKDVGAERWAITKNENGTLTGNVFRSDGGLPAFVFCGPGNGANNFDCFGADGCLTNSSADARGIQGVPDATRVLAQKDVGAERWAMSLNFDDGTATGNIFRSDGGEPAFVVCTPTGAPNTFDCSGADKCLGTPCTQPFTPIATVTLPESFFALPDPCNAPYTDIGNVDIPPSFFQPVASVTFNLSVTAAIQAFQLRVTYATSLGTFAGENADVSCTVEGGGGVFTKNDNENGALLFSLANTSNLTFPVTVRCGFDATGTLAASDFAVQVQEVTQNNAPGDASVLNVAVTVP